MQVFQKFHNFRKFIRNVIKKFYPVQKNRKVQFFRNFKVILGNLDHSDLLASLKLVKNLGGPDILEL